ncbi:Uncharacterised protein [Mycobacterium tuberculosis]|uniref:Uncharacterized protein n=1 Tax=Mycobacterium tuberculosis TaxID=1773 RepID=A0A655AGG5_MYCTX|nr:Uncharacterised protein [Mycobacterium tuberculosis]CNU87881.1 Uncharacterised protein [Mycobacterium tuberculosis]CNU95244.1 Uncharacterised protein [Mycobacterium tuberculosis]
MCSPVRTCWFLGRQHDEPRTPTHRAVRAGARRADLPYLGADLRLQPSLRALPVVLGQTRSRRVVHPPMQGHHRRTGTHAGVLREHRRRRTNRAPGLLGAGRLRHRTPRRGEILHQRGPDHPRGGHAAGSHRLRRRSDLTRRRHGRGQRRHPRHRVVRHGGARAAEPGSGGICRRQDLGCDHPAQRRPARRIRHAGKPLRSDVADNQVATVRARD